MSKWKLYTPEGFQDILFNECFIKRNIEGKLRNLFIGCGYLEIETPMLEFYDTFSMEKEFSPQESTFKLFDKEGRIMVIRPDMTIPIARVMATKLKEMPLPGRISYIGNTLRNEELGGGKQHEFTQAGLEIIGEKNPSADAEVLVMAIKSLKKTGLIDFQIDVGQVEFFKGLMDELKLNENDKQKMRVLVDKKDYLGIEELISGYDIKEPLLGFVKKLPDQFGNIELIDKVQKIIKNRRSTKALENLKEIFVILKEYDLEKYISIDLGLVRSLEYYTGVIFRGFTYGIGFPVLSGGRYDGLIEKYGEKMPAVGFSAGINLIMLALDRQDIKCDTQNIDTIIGFNKGFRKSAIFISDALKNQGLNIIIDITDKTLEELKNSAKSKNIGGIIWVLDNENVEIIDIAKDSKKVVSINQFIKKE
jgi:ATP phosphoribosyltransferase regulatory subunit